MTYRGIEPFKGEEGSVTCMQVNPAWGGGMCMTYRGIEPVKGEEGSVTCMQVNPTWGGGMYDI